MVILVMVMITLLIERENRLLGEAGAVEAVVEGIRMHGNNLRVYWKECYTLSFLGDNGCSTRFAYKDSKKVVVILLNDISYDYAPQMKEACQTTAWLKQRRKCP